MPSRYRSALHNTRFYDASDPAAALGGLYQNGSITEANFLSILEILLATEGKPVRVQARISGHIVTQNNMSLAIGDYDIYSDDPIQVTNEPWIHRLSSLNTAIIGTRFCDEVRARDKKCVITGVAHADVFVQSGIWTGLEANYIFPLEQESRWIQLGFARWITDIDDSTGSSKIESAQNGFLLNACAQDLFNRYVMSVNPDDGYKIVVFGPDIFGYNGRILDPVCRNPSDPHRVSDQLLRWHFRQSVLANMRGVGEPFFEHDFEPGTDILGEILAGPYGKERFELEMAVRLREVCFQLFFPATFIGCLAS
ncbi:hypothetical protein HOY82DRAFT_522182 [Tuber indicum]|nr:hypothetical protein HOY82DRAFT_522182 [Tuber indicum]